MRFGGGFEGPKSSTQKSDIKLPKCVNGWGLRIPKIIIFCRFPYHLYLQKKTSQMISTASKAVFRREFGTLRD